MSKLPEDWIKDVILSPVINNGQELSLGQAIRYFQDDFDILGTSPGMFTDYSFGTIIKAIIWNSLIKKDLVC